MISFFLYEKIEIKERNDNESTFSRNYSILIHPKLKYRVNARNIDYAIFPVFLKNFHSRV